MGHSLPTPLVKYTHTENSFCFRSSPDPSVNTLEKALVVDSPGSMSSYVCHLHPFPDGVASSPGLQSVSRALASRQKAEAAADLTTASATAAAASAAAAIALAGEAAAGDAGEAASSIEVWQAAERLVEASVGEGGFASRSAGSLLASLSRLRGALHRCSNGGGGGVGAWEAISSGPKGVALARAAVGAVVRICRSERPAAVHLEASRLAGEVRRRRFSGGGGGVGGRGGGG